MLPVGMPLAVLLSDTVPTSFSFSPPCPLWSNLSHPLRTLAGSSAHGNGHHLRSRDAFAVLVWLRRYLSDSSPRAAFLGATCFDALGFSARSTATSSTAAAERSDSTGAAGSGGECNTTNGLGTSSNGSSIRERSSSGVSPNGSSIGSTSSDATRTADGAGRPASTGNMRVERGGDAKPDEWHEFGSFFFALPLVSGPYCSRHTRG